MIDSMPISFRSFYVLTHSKTKLLNFFFLGAILALSGCSDTQPPETFSRPDYSYLPSLYFNVGQLNITNQAPIDDKNIAEQSPTPPASTLTLMAQQRLKTTGATGTASFAITQANITKQAHHILAGTLSIKLTVDDPTQQHHGQITATVHQERSISSKLSQQRNLYALNQSMMDDMNVEVEYQIRKHLSDWLTDATGTPLNGQINSQDLNNTVQQSNVKPNTVNSNISDASPVKKTQFLQ